MTVPFGQPPDEIIVPDDEPKTSADTIESSWASIRRFWIVSAVLGVVLLALLPLIDNGYVAVPDEGLYSAQAAALSHGNWKTDRPAPDFNVDGRLDPLLPSAIVGDSRIPYHRHPLFPLTLVLGYTVAGSAGLLILSIAGSWVTAVMTGLIGRRFNASYGIPAMLLTGLGSSLLFSTYLVVGQSIAAALSASIIYFSFTAIEHRRIWLFIPLGVVSFLLPCYRSEGTILIAGVTLALGISAIVSVRVDNRRGVRTFIAGIVVAGAGFAGYVTDMIATRAIGGSVSSFYTNPTKSIGGEQTDVLRGTWIALFQPWLSVEHATPWIAVAALATAAGVISLHFAPRHRLGAMVLFGAASVASFGTLLYTDTLVAGLFATSPLLFFAIFWTRRSQLKDPATLILAITCVITTAGIAMTIYGDGGAAQWGGRFFQVLIPLLVPLSICGMDSAAKRLDLRTRTFCGACIILIALLLSATALKVNHSSRYLSKNIVETISSTIESTRRGDTGGDGRLLSLLAQQPSSGDTRALWRSDASLDLLIVNFKGLFTLLTSADFGDYDRVLVMSSVNPVAFEVLNQTLIKDYSISVEPVKTVGRVVYWSYVYSNLPDPSGN